MKKYFCVTERAGVLGADSQRAVSQCVPLEEKCGKSLAPMSCGFLRSFDARLLGLFCVISRSYQRHVPVVFVSLWGHVNVKSRSCPCAICAICGAFFANKFDFLVLTQEKGSAIILPSKEVRSAGRGNLHFLFCKSGSLPEIGRSGCRGQTASFYFAGTPVHEVRIKMALDRPRLASFEICIFPKAEYNRDDPCCTLTKEYDPRQRRILEVRYERK